MTTFSSASRARTLTVLVLALAMLGAFTVVASAAPAEPTMVPSNGYRDLRSNDPRVDFGGRVDTADGWSYGGEAWVEFRDASGGELVRDDVSPAVSVASDGTISGSTTLNAQAGPRADAKTVRFAVLVTKDGQEQVGHSADLVIDREVPQIAGASVIDPRTIQITFTEEVESPSGDDRRDWTVEDATVSGVRQPSNGDLRLRYLDLTSALPEGAEPEVRYATALFNSRYVDFAGRALGDENNPTRANDEIPPDVPSIDSIDGVAPTGGVIVRGEDRPEVRVSNVRAGHRVELWRDGLVDSTRDFDRGAPDIRLASKIVPDGASEIVFTSSDYSQALPAEDAQDDPVVHTLFVRAVDGDGRDAVASARYQVDRTAPEALSAAGDGRFVTVRFSEPITGTNRPEDWRVTTGGPVESVTGSGDTRVVRTAGTAGGRITWTAPTAEGVVPYEDEHGNRLAEVDLPIDRPGQLRVTDATAAEGSPLAFVVSVARPDGDTTTYAVDYATVDGTATSGDDYTPQAGRLSFSGSETSKTVSVPTARDEVAEGSETMTLQFSNPGSGATLPNPSHATGTITDPGATEGLSVFDTRAHEGSTARAVIQLAKAVTKDVTVRWATEDGTAKAGSDYRASSGTARIPAGTREAVVTVPLTEDDATEPTERFTIKLSDAVNASLARATATVSILDGLGVAPGIGRVSGPSRVETSAEVSRTFFAAADTVVVATANAYPDALAGAPLAEKHGAPILLTTRERLHPAIATEVRRLGARTAYVLGGGAALSSQVDRDLRANGVTTIHRLAGTNRFDTARRIATEVGGDAVYVVEGNNRDPKRGWPDAVAVSALAAAQQRPILLVERDRLPGETSAALSGLDPSRATIVGGTAAVNESVQRAVDERAGTVDRIAGRTRYETSRAVATRAVAAGFDPGNTFFATGDDWPDSLSASPAVARTGGILLLVDSDRLDDSPPAREWLVTHRDGLRSITLIGGTKAISQFVADQIRSQSGLRPR